MAERRSGCTFTLVELLIWIVVLAFIACVFVPAFVIGILPLR